jgi:hypothetical protein
MPWTLNTGREITVKTGGTLAGLNINLNANQGVFIAQTGAVQASEIAPQSSLTVASRNGVVQVNGTLWFSRIDVSAQTLYVGNTGHISTDTLGGNTGDAGEGTHSEEGGGGGGHGGRGAQACHNFSNGGVAHGDVAMPVALGGRGGAGVCVCPCMCIRACMYVCMYVCMYGTVAMTRRMG